MGKSRKQLNVAKIVTYEEAVKFKNTMVEGVHYAEGDQIQIRRIEGGFKVVTRG